MLRGTMTYASIKNISLSVVLFAAAGLLTACSQEKGASVSDADSELQNAINQLIDEITTQPADPLPE